MPRRNPKARPFPPDERWAMPLPQRKPSRKEVAAMKQQVIERDKDHLACRWCNRPFAVENGVITNEPATLEHIVRLADGGRHVLSNCALACEKCNNERHGRG